MPEQFYKLLCEQNIIGKNALIHNLLIFSKSQYEYLYQIKQKIINL